MTLIALNKMNNFKAILPEKIRKKWLVDTKITVYFYNDDGKVHLSNKEITGEIIFGMVSVCAGTKFRATMLKTVRKLLQLKNGDDIVWYCENDKYYIRNNKDEKRNLFNKF